MPLITACGLLLLCAAAGPTASALDRGTKVLDGRKKAKKLAKRMRKAGFEDAAYLRLYATATTDEEKALLMKWQAGLPISKEEWNGLVPGMIQQGFDACKISPDDESGMPDPSGKVLLRDMWR